MARRSDTETTANTLLFDARCRMPSPLRHGKCMTRAELADAVNAAMQALYPSYQNITAFEVDNRWIGKLERGAHRWASDVRRAALRRVLNVSTDAEIGLHPQALRDELDLPLIEAADLADPLRRSEGSSSTIDAAPNLAGPRAANETLEPADGGRSVRLDGFEAFGGIGIGDGAPLGDLSTLAMDSQVPASISWNDVDQMRYITRALAVSENMFGGGFSGQAAAAQLRFSANLLSARATDDVRQKMHEAVGNLSGVVGFSAFDVANYRSAMLCFNFEYWCADSGRAGSWPLRASALSNMARLRIYLGEYDEALSLVEFAQVRADRLSATTRAMLCAIRARLLALQGRYEEALSEVARSDDHFASQDRLQDPPWMSYYDEAEHQGSTGRALTHIAVARNDLDTAIPRLQQAVRLHDATHPRSRAFSQTRMASLMMKIGDPREAATVGRAVLSDAQAVRSARLSAEIQKLGTLAGPHARIREVADLQRDIDRQRSIGA